MHYTKCGKFQTSYNSVFCLVFVSFCFFLSWNLYGHTFEKHSVCFRLIGKISSTSWDKLFPVWISSRQKFMKLSTGVTLAVNSETHPLRCVCCIPIQWELHNILSVNVKQTFQQTSFNNVLTLPFFPYPAGINRSVTQLPVSRSGPSHFSIQERVTRRPAGWARSADLIQPSWRFQ